MPTRIVPTVALVAMIAASPIDAQSAPNDWPGFRGPNASGAIAGATPPAKWSDDRNLAWKVDLPGAGASSPIVVGDRVYVTCYSGFGVPGGNQTDPSELEHHIVCVDRRSGEILWNRRIDGALRKRPRKVQISEHGFATPTPVCDGETIYAYFGPAGVVAVDLDGVVRWHAAIGEPNPDAAEATNRVVRNGKALDLNWGAAASPALCGDLLIVNAGEDSHSVRAFDKRTGKLVWTRDSANLEGCASSPAVVGEGAATVVVLGLGGEVWALAPSTGDVVWRVETKTRGGIAPTPVSDGKVVYTFGGGRGFALRLGPIAGEDASDRVLWKGEDLDIPSPVLHDGRLILVRQNGILVCLDAATGAKTLKARLGGKPGRIYASPIVADGKLYVVSRTRGTFVYALDGDAADGAPTLVARNAFDDDSTFNASPTAVGRQLFIRSDKRLYCIESLKRESVPER